MNPTDSARRPGKLAYFRRANTDLILLSAVVLFILSVAWLSLNKIEKALKGELEIALGNTVKSVSGSVLAWGGECTRSAEIWAASRRSRTTVALQLALPRERQALLDGPAQQWLREPFTRTILARGSSDIFIISPERVCLASSADRAVSARLDLIEDGDFLSPVFRRLSLLYPSGGHLAGLVDPLEKNAGLELLAAVPILDESDSVIAAVVLRSAPDVTLENILRFGRLGETGETFLFDSAGRMLTGSRFEDQLQELGLFQPAAGEGLSISLRDPGGALLSGFRPALTLEDPPLTKMAAQAVAGRPGIDLAGYRSYLGSGVVGAWEWIDQLGLGVATEINADEAYHAYREIRLLVLSVLGLTVLLLASLLVRLTRSREKAVGLAENATLVSNQLQKEISVRRKVENVLRESDEYIRAIVNSVLEGIITTDESGKIETFNPAAEKIFGYKDSEITGTDFRILVADTHQGLLEKRFERYRASGTSGLPGSSLELKGRRKKGTVFPMELSISEMRPGVTRKLTMIVRDITKHKRLEKKLRQLSSLDGLTGIANRRTFDRALDLEWQRASRNADPLSLIMLDIDFFKDYNDSLGHQAGDDTLKKIAGTLRILFKRPGDLSARYGGEEFVVLLPQTGPGGAGLLADRLRSEVEMLGIVHPGSHISKVVTISLGVASLVPKRGSRPEELVSEADKALYQAKDEGRNRVVKKDLIEHTVELKSGAE